MKLLEQASTPCIEIIWEIIWEINNVPVLSPVQSNLSLKFNLSKYQWNAIRVLLSCYHRAIYFDYWWRFHSGAFGEIGVCASISCLQMSDPSVSPPILSPATKNQALDNIAAEDLHLAERFFLQQPSNHCQEPFFCSTSLSVPWGAGAGRKDTGTTSLVEQ